MYNKYGDLESYRRIPVQAAFLIMSIISHPPVFLAHMPGHSVRFASPNGQVVKALKGPFPYIRSCRTQTSPPKQVDPRPEYSHHDIGRVYQRSRQAVPSFSTRLLNLVTFGGRTRDESGRKNADCISQVKLTECRDGTEPC